MTGSHETPAQLDRSIDRLLRERPGQPARDDSELVATARLLRDALPRFHPRFSFEEHLAARLGAIGRPFTDPPPPPTPIHPPVVDADRPADADGDRAASERRRRGLVAGGAIASGVSLAIPIAGAAIVVWRRSRSHGGFL